LLNPVPGLELIMPGNTGDPDRGDFFAEFNSLILPFLLACQNSGEVR
jgi:hypothetical protein